MLKKAKYIRTEEDNMIIFSKQIKHNDFKNFCPISAGFIESYKNKDGKIKFRCFDKSESLNLGPQWDDDVIVEVIFGKKME